MEDYCQDAIQLYLKTTKLTKLNKALTPFVPEGSPPPADEDVRGDLAGDACSLVMKDLWLARLARPDLFKAICDLAAHMQSWSINGDKRLYRLMCYMSSTTKLKMVGKVSDPPEKLKLKPTSLEERTIAEVRLEVSWYCLGLTPVFP